MNSWIKKWLKGIDYKQYSLTQGGYSHLPLWKKRQLLAKIDKPEITVCEDVAEHYAYWQFAVNTNTNDCCNLRIYENKD